MALLGKAQQETEAAYAKNPQFKIVYSTSIINEYMDKIIDLLKR